LSYAILKAEESHREGEKRLNPRIHQNWGQARIVAHCARPPPVLGNHGLGPLCADPATSFGTGGVSGLSGAFSSLSP